MSMSNGRLTSNSNENETQDNLTTILTQHHVTISRGEFRSDAAAVAHGGFRSRVRYMSQTKL